jgi:transposase
MSDATIIKWIRTKYLAIVTDLDERGRRRWAAAEAMSLGWGGISAVAKATGFSDRTIRTGIIELKDPNQLPSNKQRKPGGGRHSRENEQPELLNALKKLVESTTRGDPMSPLRWTCKSIRTLAKELNNQEFIVSCTKVSQLLHSQGYSLQSNRKTVEGKQHTDRDAQFRHIAKRVRAFERTNQPAISVDTKKKETLGNITNKGKTYRPQGNPTKVKTHDFPDKKLGKAVPYGVYDIAHNEAGVSVGISHDTAEFAVAAIRRWWAKMGKNRYPSAKRLLVTADSGGSNSPRTRLWLWELGRFANKTGLAIELCHYPPGTSKWNKIEHRLFCHITRNWQGIPLEDITIVVNLIGSTKTEEGLDVHAWLDRSQYEKARKITDAQLANVRIKRDKFHGDWNYQILPSR